MVIQKAIKNYGVFSFNKIENCLELLQLYFLGRNITISLKEYKYIQKLYRTMNIKSLKV